jgi:hypothetical protein
MVSAAAMTVGAAMSGRTASEIRQAAKQLRTVTPNAFRF